MMNTKLPPVFASCNQNQKMEKKKQRFGRVKADSSMKATVIFFRMH